MTKEVEARVKIFQRAMVACHSSNPTDCVEWFADRIVELEKENAELKEKLNKIERKCRFNFVDLLHDVENESKQEEQLTKAKEIILRLYNAGRDVLMCRAEENAYDNLSNAINDKSIEQFISEVEKCGQ